MTRDATYQSKVYFEQGGDQVHVGDGGAIVVDKGGQINLLAPVGDTWFVDSVNGDDANDGNSWATAFKTITAAVAAAAADDTIFLKGSFTEAVTVSVAGLQLIGVGTGTKQAQWGAAADAVCLTIAAAYVEVRGIYFKPPAYAANRSAAAICLSGANHARIIGNRFQGQIGSQIAIHSPVCDSDNVWILGNEFCYLNTATYGTAILGVEAGGLNYSGWRICDNLFQSCLKAIDVSCRVAEIVGNTIGEYGVNPAGAIAQLLSLGIDLSGTNSGGNMVHGNQLGGAYSATLYKVGAAGDQWAGNWNVLTGGVTAANPA